MINLDPIVAAKTAKEPFQFFATEGVLSDEDLAAINRDFPNIEKPGIFPLSALTYGPAFAKLIEDIRSPALAT